MAEYTRDDLLRMSDEEFEKYLREQEREAENSNVEEESETLEEQEQIEYNNNATESKPHSTQENVLTQTEETETPKEQQNINLPEAGTYRIKANGKEYDMTLDELIKLAPKAMDYVKKTTQIKPYRTMISSMEEHGISKDDINTLIDIKKGNKEAIAKLIKDSQVDVYDLPEAEAYKPTQYTKNEKSFEFDEVVKELSADRELFNRTADVYKNMDRETQTLLYENPDFLRGLQEDIKSGLFDEIYPHVEKSMAIDSSTPFFRHYLAAGTAVVENKKKALQAKQHQNQINQQFKKSAGLPRGSAATQQSRKISIDDIDLDNDEEFDKLYTRIMTRQY